MTKHKNTSQRTPQMDKTRGDPPRRNYPDLTLRQTTGTTSAPGHTVELAAAPTQATTVVPSNEELQRTLFTTPHQTAAAVDNTAPPGAPDKERSCAGRRYSRSNVKKFRITNFDTLNNLLQECHEDKKCQMSTNYVSPFGKKIQQV